MLLFIPGKSLLWVMFLGVIIIFIFGLVTFAALRRNMTIDGEQPFYCSDLFQCTVSVMRFGLTGELLEVSLCILFINTHAKGQFSRTQLISVMILHLLAYGKL